MLVHRVLLALICLLPGWVLADGRYFQSGVQEAKPTIPFQRAVLKFDGQEEVMIVESTLQGPAGKYGWVVPLPTKPSYVKAVNPAYVTESFRQVNPPIFNHADSSVNFMLCAGAIFGIVLLTSGLRHRKRELGFRVLFFVAESVGMLIIFGIFFPVFTQAKASAKGEDRAAATKSVRVESLGTIGSYEVSVVSGDRASDILGWLKERDMEVGSEALPVIDAYSKEGWCFLAAEIRKTDTGTYPPHPLKAVFPTSKLIYPMRLTGLQDQPLHLELLVVSDHEAKFKGMETWACDNRDIKIPINLASNIDREVYSDWHSGLYAMAKNNAVWTYLRGDMNPSQMREDYLAEWKPMDRQAMEVWDREVAKNQALSRFAIYFIVISTLVGLGLACLPKLTDRKFGIGSLLAVGLAIGGSMIWYASVKKVETESFYVNKGLDLGTRD